MKPCISTVPYTILSRRRTEERNMDFLQSLTQHPSLSENARRESSAVYTGRNRFIINKRKEKNRHASLPRRWGMVEVDWQASLALWCKAESEFVLRQVSDGGGDR